MYKIALLCLTLLFAGCSNKPKCDSSKSKELVMESVEKTVKRELATKLNSLAIGDEWPTVLSDDERKMVEFNYSEYGPVLLEIKSLNETDAYSECSAKLRFRNAQEFSLFYRLQKDTNGKLHAIVEWR